MLSQCHLSISHESMTQHFVSVDDILARFVRIDVDPII
jgi:hypothetical protein